MGNGHGQAGAVQTSQFGPEMSRILLELWVDVPLNE